jgi:hypothetical protein
VTTTTSERRRRPVRRFLWRLQHCLLGRVLKVLMHMSVMFAGLSTAVVLIFWMLQLHTPVLHLVAPPPVAVKDWVKPGDYLEVVWWLTKSWSCPGTVQAFAVAEGAWTMLAHKDFQLDAEGVTELEIPSAVATSARFDTPTRFVGRYLIPAELIPVTLRDRPRSWLYPLKFRLVVRIIYTCNPLGPNIETLYGPEFVVFGFDPELPQPEDGKP